MFYEYNQNILSKKDMSSARFSILGFWKGNFQAKFIKNLNWKGDKKSWKGGKLKEREYLNYLREEIFKEVKRCAEVGKNWPGYFFATGNHIPNNVPLENALCYLDLIKKLGEG